MLGLLGKTDHAVLEIHCSLDVCNYYYNKMKIVHIGTTTKKEKKLN